jgi:hypothetical protein
MPIGNSVQKVSMQAQLMVPMQISTPTVPQAQQSSAHPNENVNQATTPSDKMDKMDVDNQTSPAMTNQQGTILPEAQVLVQNQQAIVFPVVDGINEILSEIESTNPSINNATVTFLSDSFMQGQISDTQITNPTQKDNYKDEFDKSDDEEMKTPPPTVLDDTDEEKSPAAASN